MVVRLSPPMAKTSSQLLGGPHQKWESARKERSRRSDSAAVRDRKRSIRVGYGLEPILPDGKVGVWREAVPHRRGRPDGAVSLLTWRIADVIAKDAGVEITTSQLAALIPPPHQTELSPARLRDYQCHHRAGCSYIAALFYMFLFEGSRWFQRWRRRMGRRRWLWGWWRRFLMVSVVAVPVAAVPTGAAVQQE